MGPRVMKIAILDMTEHPEDLLHGMPPVGTQIIAWLGPFMPDDQLKAYAINAKGAALPGVDDFDGLLVSGSEKGVYDDTPWDKPLRTLLTQTQAAGKPIFGICYGHQIMADTFGGKAELSEVGNVVGARSFVTPGGPVDAHVWHKDQVTQVPPGASVTMSAAHCPVGGLEYDFPAKSVQFHPEYTEAHLRELFKRGRDLFLKGDEADAAVKTFEKATVARDLMARETAAFFHAHG